MVSGNCWEKRCIPQTKSLKPIAHKDNFNSEYEDDDK